MESIEIRFPKLGFKRDGYVNWRKINSVAWMSLLFLVVAGFILGGTWWCVSRLVTKPHVVVVHESALTAAQNEFIKQCETNHRVPNGSNFDDYAIPNVHVEPWTCTFANNPNSSGYGTGG